VFRLKWSGANLESARDEGASGFEWLHYNAHPRRLHVIAHSHGGNVVRAGIEQLARRNVDLRRIRAVVSMGTPFFTYARTGVIALALAQIAAGIALMGPMLLCLYLFAGPAGVAKQPLSAWWFLAGCVFCAVVSGAMINGGWTLLGRPLRGTLPGAVRVHWVNLCSETDEAIQLLNTFVPRLRLFGGSKKSPDGPVWWGLVIAVSAVVLGAAILIAARMAPGSNLAQAGALAAGAGGIGVLYRLLKLTHVLVTNGASRVLDRIVVGRLRALACGDDVAAGITGVSTNPWRSHGAAHVPLPAAVEAEIEGRIAQATSGLWVKLRAAIAPGASFLDANIPHIVDQVLTGDELSHTVYYRVDGFVDVVADLLVATGDYVFANRLESVGRPINP
jgi:hypothetical protein